MNLEAARAECGQLRLLRKAGIDPQDHKRQGRRAVAAKVASEIANVEADAYTVGVLCREFMVAKQTVPSRRTGRLVSRKTLQGYNQLISAEIEPRWKDRPVRSITRRELVDARDAIAKRGPIQANRFVTLVHMLFKYAVERERIEANPAADLDRAVTEKERERVLSDDELQKLMRWIPESPLDESTRTALLLVAYTGARNLEVAQAHAREFEGGVWLIPVERTKNHREHKIYLSRQAAALIKNRDGYLFCKRGSDKPMDADGFADRIRRARETLKIPPWSLHDLRRSMSSWLQDKGHSRELADERMLNHKPQGVAKHYDRANRDEPARKAWQEWANHLSALKQSNVLPMRAG